MILNLTTIQEPEHLYRQREIANKIKVKGMMPNS